MDHAALMFLAFAIFVIVMAILLTWLFRKTINRDKKLDDPNGNHHDGDSTAVWMGIDGSDLDK